jgi:molybdopterin-guanine dinucleotide biosynthesis protein A
MIGVVLAGGKSSRLGQDKTAVLYQGQTLLERSARLLGACCEEVFVSCRDPRIVPPGLTVLEDETERVGPLGGITTALRHLGGPVFALACDLPFMERRFLDALIQAREARPEPCLMTAWEQRDTGFIEALVAIYEPAALPLFEAGIAAGHFKLSRLIPPHLRHTLVYGPEDSRFFFNVNYPQDLGRLRPNVTSA